MLKEISIEIIRKCPNHCVHCSSLSDERCSGILGYERFVSVVTDAASLGAQTICLSGGEPFLHPRIVEMISFINSLGLQSYVYTSGIVLNQDNEKVSLSTELLQAISGKVTKLIFNIEAANAETYNQVMGTNGCFEKMQHSVLEANSFSIVTEAHFVPMRLNINEVEATIALCKKLRVTKISFLRLVLHGRAQLNEERITLAAEDFLGLKNKLVALQREKDIDIRIGVPMSAHDACHKCEAAKGKLNIKYDGKVFPCEVFKNDRIAHQLRGLKPESIYENSLLEIYHNSLYLQLVRQLSQDFSCHKHYETCIGQHLLNSFDQRGDQSGQ